MYIYNKEVHLGRLASHQHRYVAPLQPSRIMAHFHCTRPQLNGLQKHDRLGQVATSAGDAEHYLAFKLLM